MKTLVLGAGIVGSAAVWDLLRRGHEVTVADADLETVERISASSTARAIHLDASDTTALLCELKCHNIVVSALPYKFGFDVARSAIMTNTHYLDFGGNPDVVAAQRLLHSDALVAGVIVVPDCGLAPGLANVIAQGLISSAGDDLIESIQLRVGALPQEPKGALGYQVAFSSSGLINEYSEPCEIIEDGVHKTVEPLSRFEDVAWEGWGPLEAFSTAGGTSTMAYIHAGRVRNLEYKTLRYKGHGNVFRSMYEIGLFDETERSIKGGDETSLVAPRDLLINALDHALPRGAPDVVLLRVWMDQGSTRTVIQMVDTERDGFSSLARTTAFPTTGLADLIARGSIDSPGVSTMNETVTATELLNELTPVDIETESYQLPLT